MVRRLVDDNRTPWAWGLVLAIGFAFVGTAGPVFAQEPSTDERSPEGNDASGADEPTGDGERTEETTVELTGEQKRLNNKAIEAITGDSKSPSAAVRYLKAALMVGPKGNVLYMALGRAHQLDGNCEKATAIFEKAIEAPQVESVPREQVMARIENYRGDLETSCPGVLVVECSPASVNLTVDDETVSCGNEVTLSPGTYTVEGTLQDFSPRTQTVEIVPMKKKVVRIEFGLSAAAETAKDDVHTSLSGARSAQAEAHRQAESRRRRGQTKADSEQLANEIVETATGLVSPERNVQAAGGDDATGDTQKRRDRRRWVAILGKRMRGVFRARVPFGGYFVQLEDGDTAGGWMYGGSVIASVGYLAPPMWALENRMQFDWLQALSANTDPLGIDLDTWRFQDDLRWWWNSIGLGMFIDYRHHRTRIGNQGASADERTTNTLVAGPSLVISSKDPFTGDGHFRIYGRWGPLLQGRDGQFQVGVNMAAKHVELSIEYERLTGEHDPNRVLRRGELLMVNLGARLTLGN